MTVPAHDPYAIRTLEQFLRLLDNGDFLELLENTHRDLCKQIYEHYERHGEVGAKGMITIKIAYQMPRQADLQVAAQFDTKPPKPRAAMANMYADEQGRLTLYSPLMKRADEGLRDVSDTINGTARDITPDHDPDTGEVRDIS